MNRRARGDGNSNCRWAGILIVADQAGKQPVADPFRDLSAKPTVTEFLERCIGMGRKVTARQVEEATGVPEGTIKGWQAWKDYRAHLATKQPRPTDAQRRALPLHKEADSIIQGKEDDPAELVEARDAMELSERIKTDSDYRVIVERQYLDDENADPLRRAEYHRMRQDERLQQLITWKLFGLD